MEKIIMTGKKKLGLLIICTLFNILLFTPELSGSEKQLVEILNDIQNKLNDIDRIEYFVQRIDTFSSGGIENNKGYALIEKDNEDEVFGFSFYGNRFDIDEEFIYSNGLGYHINPNDKNYKIENAGYGCIGCPGGQMVFANIFKLYTDYQSVELVNNKNSIEIIYKFEDNLEYGVTNRVKIFFIDKDNYLPIKAIQSYIRLDKKSVHEWIFSDIKINSAVKNTIDKKKLILQTYEEIKTNNDIQENKFLGEKILDIELPNIINSENNHLIKSGKITLIDFWEVWCGHCISSLSEIEKLKIKYSDDLLIFGIICDDTSSVIKQINEKNITFPNLIGNNDLLKKYDINSFPRYFLIDKNGIFRKEYHGFKKDEIISDIDRLLAE